MKGHRRPLGRPGRGSASARRTPARAATRSPVRSFEPACPARVLNAPDLEAPVWEAANILRDSPVDRTDWKSSGEDYPDQHRPQGPSGGHRTDVMAPARNVGTALAHAMRGVRGMSSPARKRAP